jgi:hypothetical protein
MIYLVPAGRKNLISLIGKYEINVKGNKNVLKGSEFGRRGSI